MPEKRYRSKVRAVLSVRAPLDFFNWSCARPLSSSVRSSPVRTLATEALSHSTRALIFPQASPPRVELSGTAVFTASRRHALSNFTFRQLQLYPSLSRNRAL